MENKQPNRTSPGDAEHTKKPYHTPHLVNYGKVTDQTLAIKNKGATDGGIRPLKAS